MYKPEFNKATLNWCETIKINCLKYQFAIFDVIVQINKVYFLFSQLQHNSVFLTKEGKT